MINYFRGSILLLWVINMIESIIYDFNWTLIIAIFSCFISVVSLYNSWRSRTNNEKFWLKEQYYKSLSEAVKIESSYDNIFPDENRSLIMIHNKSDFKVYDVIVLQGLNNMDIFNGQCTSKACYVREICGQCREYFTMQYRGLGMSKFLVVGVFFRDFQGNEWYRDSYGITKVGYGYKEKLSKLKLITPPYPYKIDNR